MFKNSKRNLKKLIQVQNKTILCQSEKLEGLSRLGLVLVNLNLKTERNERAINFYTELKETFTRIHNKTKEFNLKYQKEAK